MKIWKLKQKSRGLFKLINMLKISHPLEWAGSRSSASIQLSLTSCDLAGLVFLLDSDLFVWATGFYATLTVTCAFGLIPLEFTRATDLDNRAYECTPVFSKKITSLSLRSSCQVHLKKKIKGRLQLPVAAQIWWSEWPRAMQPTPTFFFPRLLAILIISGLCVSTEFVSGGDINRQSFLSISCTAGMDCCWPVDLSDPVKKEGGYLAQCSLGNVFKKGLKMKLKSKYGFSCIRNKWEYLPDFIFDQQVTFLPNQNQVSLNVAADFVSHSLGDFINIHNLGALAPCLGIACGTAVLLLTQEQLQNTLLSERHHIKNTSLLKLNYLLSSGDQHEP